MVGWWDGGLQPHLLADVRDQRQCGVLGLSGATYSGWGSEVRQETTCQAPAEPADGTHLAELRFGAHHHSNLGRQDVITCQPAGQDERTGSCTKALTIVGNREPEME